MVKTICESEIANTITVANAFLKEEVTAEEYSFVCSNCMNTIKTIGGQKWIDIATNSFKEKVGKDVKEDESIQR